METSEQWSENSKKNVEKRSNKILRRHFRESSTAERYLHFQHEAINFRARARTKRLILFLITQSLQYTLHWTDGNSLGIVYARAYAYTLREARGKREEKSNTQTFSYVRISVYLLN